jgi:hypothetical protein
MVGWVQKWLSLESRTQGQIFGFYSTRLLAAFAVKILEFCNICSVFFFIVFNIKFPYSKRSCPKICQVKYVLILNCNWSIYLNLIKKLNDISITHGDATLAVLCSELVFVASSMDVNPPRILEQRHNCLPCFGFVITFFKSS